VLVAPTRKLPLVTVSAVFPNAGAASEPADQAGIAQLVAAMLVEGTTTRDGAGLAEAFETLGSSLSIAADWDCITATFTVQPSRLFAAIDLVREVFLMPSFSAPDLARLKGEHHSGRLQLTADSRALGDAAFAWSCYQANDSRFRRPIDGTLATVAGLSREQLAAQWRSARSTGNLTLIIVGDVSPADADRAATILLHGWEHTPPAVQSTGSMKAGRTAPSVTLVEKPDSAQAELRIGHIGVPRSHPSYYELTVMNAVLGGLFSSRINLNLRERNGYTYGAFSGFDWRVQPGPWVVSTAVKTEVAGAAIKEVLTEIARIREAPIATDELELATNYLVGVFPLRFETTAAVASALASLAVYGLPPNYFDSYRERIAAITPADVLRVAREHLHPESLQIVAVGDPVLLSPALAVHGDVRVISVTDVEAAR
jgi:zinc protease